MSNKVAQNMLWPKVTRQWPVSQTWIKVSLRSELGNFSSEFPCSFKLVLILVQETSLESDTPLEMILKLSTL